MHEKHPPSPQSVESGGSPAPTTPEPPDGGGAAWLTILGSSLVAFATFGPVNGYGAFNDYYEATFLSHYSPTLISMIGSIQLFLLYIFRGFRSLELAAAVASFSGALFDAFGPRYMIPASGLVSSFALFMLSISQAQHIYQQYLAQAILFSFGSCFAFFPSLAVCAHWFKGRVAFAMSFPIGCGSLGGIIYPVMLQRLIPQIGFGWTVRLVALVVLLCFLVAAATITTPRPPKPLPRLSQLLAFRAFRDPVYTCLCLGGWFSVLSAFNPFFYVGLYAAAAAAPGPPAPLTPYYLAIMSATTIVGRIGPAMVADRIGRYNVIASSTALSGVLILALWYSATAQPSLLAFAAVYGFATGPVFALLTPCIVLISPIEEVGARVGMCFAFMSTGVLAGTPLGGVFIRTRALPQFRHLILFSGLMALVGSGFFIAARLMRSRKLFAAV
ncbi:major facilitator superfamily domain-containing protein [Mycena pura]|uniref:Major facilitator superfamily domain-containing protein n=1 Tax=Mycena pura TaxID=153505 RepID=A0AAD6VD37_9AGAR|nr:major facilitator superfamily domain-containing protein [Mycena pura]